MFSLEYKIRFNNTIVENLLDNNLFEGHNKTPPIGHPGQENFRWGQLTEEFIKMLNSSVGSENWRLSRQGDGYLGLEFKNKQDFVLCSLFI